MSSILKALKKLETESSVGNTVPTRQPLSRTKKTGRHAFMGSPSFYKGTLVVSLAVILAGSLWFMLPRKAREKLPEPVSKLKVEHKSAAPVKEEKKSLPPPIAQRKTERLTKKPAETKVNPVVTSNDIVQKTTVPEPRMKLVDHPAPGPDVPPEANFTGATTPGTLEPDAPLDRFASIPVKNEDESGMKLQAIAWSEDPDRRIAVINNRVVREGGAVDEALVTHIDEDIVVFKKGGERWKQVFRIR